MIVAFLLLQQKDPLHPTVQSYSGQGDHPKAIEAIHRQLDATNPARYVNSIYFQWPK